MYPFPGSKYTVPGTQIAFRGLPASSIGAISVVGSKSGPHTGRLVGDSDGQGGSFLPTKAFTGGETVTVATHLPIAGASKGTFSFKISNPGNQLPAGNIPRVAAGARGLQHFRSRPDLEPAAVTVSKASAPASQGNIFVAPQFGPTQDGPMILDPKGKLIWFDANPLAQKEIITDFRVQNLHGQQVLTWFQGSTNSGSGRGEGIIFNDKYQEIATVRAANGLSVDLHEFEITPQGDAYIIAISPVRLPGLNREVMDAEVQEIDIATGLVLFDWHPAVAVEQVGPQAARAHPRPLPPELDLAGPRRQPVDLGSEHVRGLQGQPGHREDHVDAGRPEVELQDGAGNVVRVSA